MRILTRTRIRFSVLLVCVVILALGVGFVGGATATTTTEISDWNELDEVRDDPSGDYVLVGDLDENTDGYAGNGSDWAPIDSFDGTFDGTGHDISDLVIDQSGTGADYVGLFGNVGGSGEIRNVTLVNASVTGDDRRTGALVGNLTGTVTNSSADASVSGGNATGGLVGENHGTVTDSFATGFVDGDGSNTGGLIGLNFGTVESSHATGSVDGGNLNTGGLIGQNRGSVEASSATGAVTGEDGVGGLIGSTLGGSVTGSYATGPVDGTGLIGGLIGLNQGSVEASHATGEVEGIESVGGLIGYNTDQVNSSYATGDVAGDDVVGGLIGNNTDQVNSSYATGDVAGDDAVGGLIGYNTDQVNSSYATGDVAGDDAVGGLIGRNDDGTVTESYATGPVDGTGWDIGGLIGRNNGSVQAAHATGEVEGFFSVGGLIGWNEDGTVTTSYVTGNVEGDVSVGGLVGINDGTVENSFWDDEAGKVIEGGERMDNHSDGGEALTTHEMTGDRAPGNMTAFDFDAVWQVEADDPAHGFVLSYPVLQANTQEPAPNSKRFAEGDGSEADPYQIADWRHLDHVRLHLDANFTLVADLDASTDWYDVVANESANGGAGFEPIGDDVEQFNGTFDGAGHTISALVIDRAAESYVGLFGAVGSRGLIEGVGVVDVNVEGDSTVGGVIGWNDGGVVSESFATGTIEGDNTVGGLVGSNLEGVVTRSYATSTIKGGGFVGGLVGQNSVEAEINQSYATGSVDGNDFVGGLIGFHTGNVTESYATGAVTGSDTNVGGLIGQGYNSTVTDVYWDRGTTNQAAAIGIDDGSSINATGFGVPTDTEPAAEMRGLRAVTELSAFDFEDTWVALDAYPRLQWELDMLSLTLGTATIDEGDSTQATVTATLRDGSTETATETAVYGSDDTTVVTVTVDGRVDGISVGTTQVNATLLSLTDATTVSVVSPQSPSRSSRSADRETIVTVDVEDETTDSRVTVENPDPDVPVVILGPLVDGASAPDDVTERAPLSHVENIQLDRMTLHVGSTDDFTLDVTTYESDLTPSFTTDDAINPVVEDAAVGFERETRTLAAGYVHVDHALAVGHVTHVTFDFSITTAYLEAIGVEPDEVRLYHGTNEGWVERETGHVSSSDTHHQFEASFPGFSVFAIGTGAPTMVVTDAHLDTSDLQVGDLATVTATLENRGRAAGEHTVELLANGEVVATETIELEGLGSESVSLAFEATVPGEYALSIGSVDVGTVTVIDDGEPSPVEDEPSESIDGGVGLFTLLGLFLIILVIAGGIVVLKRRDDGEEK